MINSILNQNNRPVEHSMSTGEPDSEKVKGLQLDYSNLSSEYIIEFTGETPFVKHSYPVAVPLAYREQVREE